MNTALALVILISIVFAVGWLLERNHRRVGARDRSPFGVDLEVDRDRDADRVAADLTVARDDQGGATVHPLSRPGRTVVGHGSRHAA